MAMRLGTRRLIAMAACSAMLGAGIACFSDRGALTAPSGGQCTIPLDPNLLGSTVIAIKNFAFSPSQVSVHTGDKVTWANCDTGNPDHTTTSDTGVWDSPLLSPGPPATIFSFTFNQAGTFAFHCSVHPFMQGTVVVQ